ncbi:MAG: nucleotidyltransferase family protein [Chromatiaceae bacterium]
MDAGLGALVDIQGILLAAGASGRFGSDKLLVDVDGYPMVVRAARNLLVAGLPVVCVARDAAGPVARLLAGIPGVLVSACPEARLGMGRSLAWGVATVPRADAWLVALGDMPWVEPDTVRALSDALRTRASMVAPEYQGDRGHPVGFAGHWRAHLLALEGDQGARRLLADHPLKVQRVPVQDPGVLRDLDHPRDLPRPF